MVGLIYSQKQNFKGAQFSLYSHLLMFFKVDVLANVYI